MNKRTMLLSGGAAAVFALYLLDAGYRGYVEEPSQRYEGQLSSLTTELSDAKGEQLIGRRLAKKLDEYAERALPYDADLARSRYQDWLLQLVEKHQMQSASIDAELPRVVELRGRTDRRKRRQVGYRITYSLRARTTLAGWTDFLYDLQRSAQLHKVRSFSLNPLADGNQLDLNAVIETLTLDATERADQLSTLVHSDASIEPRESYTAFVHRNLFARGFSKALEAIRLTAITRNRSGALEAWFAVGSSSETQRIEQGDALDIPLHNVTLVAFEENRVHVRVNGLECQMKLGQSLAEVLRGDKLADNSAATSSTK